MVDRNDATASKTSIATVSTTDFVDNDTLIINDIALIQFIMPVKLTETIKPINLPTEDIGLIERTNTIVGWGQYSMWRK
uniref:Peptidase S1 domain-containing protein n=1 Tax=Acrobeloides nanus TaxID=290746 RepID=A0A914D7K8_9BILA